MLFSIETHITCDFSRGGPDSLSFRLDPHMRFLNLHIFLTHKVHLITSFEF